MWILLVVNGVFVVCKRLVRKFFVVGVFISNVLFVFLIVVCVFYFNVLCRCVKVWIVGMIVILKWLLYKVILCNLVCW